MNSNVNRKLSDMQSVPGVSLRPRIEKKSLSVSRFLGRVHSERKTIRLYHRGNVSLSFHGLASFIPALDCGQSFFLAGSHPITTVVRVPVGERSSIFACAHGVHETFTPHGLSANMFLFLLVFPFRWVSILPLVQLSYCLLLLPLLFELCLKREYLPEIEDRDSVHNLLLVPVP